MAATNSVCLQPPCGPRGLVRPLSWCGTISLCFSSSTTDCPPWPPPTPLTPRNPPHGGMHEPVAADGHEEPSAKRTWAWPKSFRRHLDGPDEIDRRVGHLVDKPETGGADGHRLGAAHGPHRRVEDGTTVAASTPPKEAFRRARALALGVVHDAAAPHPGVAHLPQAAPRR